MSGRSQGALRRGLSVYDAALDVSLVDFDSWGGAERIAVNVTTLCREFGSLEQPGNAFELMAGIRKERLTWL